MANKKPEFDIKDVSPTDRFDEIASLLAQEFAVNNNSPVEMEASDLFLQNLYIGKFKPYAIIKNDVMLGFIILEVTTKGNFYIGNLYVKPEFRHLGIASTLIKAAEYCAQNLGFNKIQLNSRAGVEQLYLNLGYINIKGDLYEKPLPQIKEIK